jgi:regulator of RNase E activity RraA
VGDPDGVVVVPQAILEATIRRLRDVQAAELKAEAMVKAGARMTASAAALLKSPRVLRL